MTNELSQEEIRQGPWQLRLYVSGNTRRSAAAIARLEQICRTQLDDEYHLEVIDLWEQPDLARENKIIATPTLIRLSPLPVQKFIGDFSKNEAVLSALQVDLPLRDIDSIQNSTGVKDKEKNNDRASTER